MTKRNRKVISAYLRKVRSATSGVEPDEQRELLATIEEHIEEALRSGRTSVDDVISGMDPPESYRPSRTGSAYLDQDIRRVGFWAIVTLACAILIPLIGLIFEFALPKAGDIANPVLITGIILLLVSLVLGFISRRTPMGKAAMISSAAIIALLTLFIPVNRQISGRSGVEEMHLEAVPNQTE